MIWNCRNKKIEYGKKVLLMGIVNVTPDSFSDGGDYFSFENAVSHAKKLEEQGADIIDIGAQSTRPEHIPVDENEEWDRLEDILKEIRKNTKLPISVDTYYPTVAKKAIETGVDIINDVSGVVSPKMCQIIKETGAGWIIMHNGHGLPEDIRSFFVNCLTECENSGIDKGQICFDMGIGFGKSFEENMSLIANVKDYKLNDYPLLLGVSRKRVIAQAGNQPNPKERIYGNIAADTAAILGGVDIIRLHNIKDEKQGVLTAEKLRSFVNG